MKKIRRSRTPQLLLDLDDIRDKYVDDFADDLQNVFNDIRQTVNSTTIRNSVNSANPDLAVTKINWVRFQKDLSGVIQDNTEPIVDDIIEYEGYDVKVNMGSYLRNNSFTEGREISNNTRDAFEKAMRKAMDADRAVFRSPQFLEELLGLTVNYVEGSWARFDKMLENFDEKYSFNAVNQYQKSARLGRYEGIAKNELWKVINRTRFKVHEKAVNYGFLDPRSIQLEWLARANPKCNICQELDMQRVGWGGRFGNKLYHPPAHSGCNCGYRVINH